jgi:hypothetical protein
MAPSRTGRLLAAGALLATAGVALTAPPSSADVVVANEAQLRAAFADPAETIISLTADIDLTDCAAGDVERPDTATPLLLAGAFTIRQTCADERVLASVSSEGEVGTLTLSEVTITGGDKTDAVSASGGGVWWDGNVNLLEATITGNAVTAPFGGLGGGLFATGEVVVEQSTISDNTAGSDGDFGGLAGALNAGRGATITESTLSGNLAAGGAEFGGTGGAIFGNSNISIVRSTVAGNSATASADGTSGGNGGGIVINAALEVVNSTITGNVATGATSNNGGAAAGDDMTIVYSTIVGNSAATAANLQTLSADPEFSEDVLFGTVISDPLGGGTNCGPASDAASVGFNYATDASCNLTATGDRQSQPAPGLLPLGNYGGPTQTMHPDEGSPLVDAIPLADCAAGPIDVAEDQRDFPRPDADLLACDIGSVERFEDLPPPPSTTTTTTPGSTTSTTRPGTPPPATPVRVTPTFAG